jgi:hypothetical protein
MRFNELEFLELLDNFDVKAEYNETSALIVSGVDVLALASTQVDIAKQAIESNRPFEGTLQDNTTARISVVEAPSFRDYAILAYGLAMFYMKTHNIQKPEGAKISVKVLKALQNKLDIAIEKEPELSYTDRRAKATEKEDVIFYKKGWD